MKAAIMVLFDDPSAQTTKHKDWIVEGLSQRGANGRAFALDLDAPDMVNFYLGRMVRFTAGQFKDNGDIRGMENGNGSEHLTNEEISFFKQLKKVLGPALKQGAKQVWYGDRLKEMEKRGQEKEVG